jgi:hypothetical protein
MNAAMRRVVSHAALSDYRHCKKIGTAAVQKCVLKKKEAGSEVRRHSIGATKIMSDCCGVRFLWRRV